MLSELQTKKLTKLFGVHDANHDGVLQESDYENMARGVAATRGWANDSSEYAALRTRMLRFWNGLAAHADASGDQRVTLKEWLAYMDELMATPGEFQTVIAPVASMIWQTLDRDGDGAVTAGDMATAYTIMGQDATLAAQNFARLDGDGDGRISLDEFLTMIDQFFRSDDPKHPGNLLFGQL